MLKFEELLRTASFFVPHLNGEEFRSYTNILFGISSVIFAETMFKKKKTSVGASRATRGQMLRPEQEVTAPAGHLISNYTRPEDMLLDPYPRTETATKACLLLLEHHKFIS